jgi:hypothetical protein
LRNAAKAARLAMRHATHGEPDAAGVVAPNSRVPDALHRTICPKRPAASDQVDRNKGVRRQAWKPTATTNAVRLALRCPTHGEPYARALHHMPYAASGLRRRGPAREELENQARPSTAANVMRAGAPVPRQLHAHFTPYAPSRHQLPTRKVLEDQARTPTGAANAVRLALCGSPHYWRFGSGSPSRVRFLRLRLRARIDLIRFF